MTRWFADASRHGKMIPLLDYEWHYADPTNDDWWMRLPNFVWVFDTVSYGDNRLDGQLDEVVFYLSHEDPGGWDALECGGRCYEEGMACDQASVRESRIEWFRAAELLYLHAAGMGNPYAHLNLGYVYSYDRCEGKYWRPIGIPPDKAHVEIYKQWNSRKNIERLAIEHFQAAAEAGIAEACYKLGDMLRDGRGCELDLDEAYRWFAKAYELGKGDTPVIWGSAALRLGRAHEEGEGCEQSFTEACVWYERATTGLSIAVRCGEDWYRGALRRAEAGLKRTKQEIEGTY